MAAVQGGGKKSLKTIEKKKMSEGLFFNYSLISM